MGYDQSMKILESGKKPYNVCDSAGDQDPPGRAVLAGEQGLLAELGHQVLQLGVPLLHADAQVLQGLDLSLELFDVLLLRPAAHGLALQVGAGLDQPPAVHDVLRPQAAAVLLRGEGVVADTQDVLLLRHDLVALCQLLAAVAQLLLQALVVRDELRERLLQHVQLLRDAWVGVNRKYKVCISCVVSPTFNCQTYPQGLRLPVSQGDRKLSLLCVRRGVLVLDGVQQHGVPRCQLGHQHEVRRRHALELLVQARHTCGPDYTSALWASARSAGDENTLTADTDAFLLTVAEALLAAVGFVLAVADPCADGLLAAAPDAAPNAAPNAAPARPPPAESVVTVPVVVALRTLRAEAGRAPAAGGALMSVTLASSLAPCSPAPPRQINQTKGTRISLASNNSVIYNSLLEFNAF
ncbi:CinA-like protein [Frankliniella fusca]|uniref:CinA-like protein n=1 Tax=Frankliniella fusca TaxID=407009 RepID=A0AAE1HRN5_9NEOP|nr:CinA-like protein [Frankliniella fusca]